jgi:hypothetical protein
VVDFNKRLVTNAATEGGFTSCRELYPFRERHW